MTEHPIAERVTHVSSELTSAKTPSTQRRLPRLGDALSAHMGSRKGEPAPTCPELQWLVFGVAAIGGATLVKLVVAARTVGQTDVLIWGQFADAALKHGPIDVYGALAINHPPGSAWLAMLLGTQLGHIPWPFIERLPTIFADIVSAYLIIRIGSRRWGVHRAILASSMTIWMPITFVQSGFHGNWDSLVIMFAISALYLMAQRRHFSAGVLFAVGVSVKLFALPLLPLLFVHAATESRRSLVRFASGGVAVFLVLWVPVLARHPSAFVKNVLGYSGANTPREWGIPALADGAGFPDHLVALLVDPGRVALVALAAFVPLLFYKTRRLELFASAGLVMTLLLFGLVAWGPQYLVWPVMLGLFAAPRLIWAYQVIGGLFTLVLYSHWSDAPIGHWFHADFYVLNGIEQILMTATWVTLGLVIIECCLAGRRQEPRLVESRDRRWRQASCDAAPPPGVSNTSC